MGAPMPRQAEETTRALGHRPGPGVDLAALGDRLGLVPSPGQFMSREECERIAAALREIALRLEDAERRIYRLTATRSLWRPQEQVCPLQASRSAADDL